MPMEFSMGALLNLIIVSSSVAGLVGWVVFTMSPRGLAAEAKSSAAKAQAGASIVQIMKDKKTAIFFISVDIRFSDPSAVGPTFRLHHTWCFGPSIIYIRQIWNFFNVISYFSLLKFRVIILVMECR